MTNFSFLMDIKEYELFAAAAVEAERVLGSFWLCALSDAGRLWN